MPTAIVADLTISYDVIGDSGRLWTITPGGRFSKEDPGIPEFAAALAERGNRVLIWDRPNTGASDVCFTGDSESQMQADVLAGLVRSLDLGPAVIAGGSGGARVSMLTAAFHPDVTSGLALWWISGGVFGLFSIANHYCGESIRAAWHGGMEAVAALPEWQEVIAANPANRQRILDRDRTEFVATLERWMAAYYPTQAELVPGLGRDAAAQLKVPTLVFRSGASDLHHRRETSEHIADVLPNAELVEPPWGDTEWNDRGAARASGAAPGLFVRWHLLAPILDAWARRALPDR
jgi:pimeloyl-ACP methyl ester carboxylesterase